MKKLHPFVSVFFLFIHVLAFSQAQSVSGVLIDSETKETIPFANILIKSTRVGTISDINGAYTLSVSNAGLYQDSGIVIISTMGYQKIEMKYSEFQKLKSLNLKKSLVKLRTHEVVAEKSEELEEVQSTQMSAVKLDMEEIKHLPAIGGEVDIIKAAQLLPGISGGVEGSTGIIVRGGNAD